MPRRQISLNLPDDDLDAVKKWAKRKGISGSEYMRRAIALQLDRDERAEPERDAARKDESGNG